MIAWATSCDWAGVPDTSPSGHEAIGVVQALGPEADRYITVGDRVILGLGGTGESQSGEQRRRDEIDLHSSSFRHAPIVAPASSRT